MSNQQPYSSAPPTYTTIAPPTAPPTYAAVDQPAGPPSYNPEFTDNNTNPIPNPQTNSNDYNTGNMYGQPQYQYEGQNAPIVSQYTPTVPAPGNYNNYAYTNNHTNPPPAMHQPLVRKTQPLSVSSISSSDRRASASHSYRHYYTTSYGSTFYPDKCKKLVLFGGICWCIAIILLCIGGVMLNDNLQFQKKATETRCTITSYNYNQCSYDCDCYTDHNDQRHCSTCWGYKYDYYATSPTCGYHNSTLYQHSYDENGACPQDFKGIGYSTKCWVVCNEATFSLSSPGELVAWSFILLGIGGCCCFGGSGFGCKYACCDD